MPSMPKADTPRLSASWQRGPYYNSFELARKAGNGHCVRTAGRIRHNLCPSHLSGLPEQNVGESWQRSFYRHADGHRLSL